MRDCSISLSGRSLTDTISYSYNIQQSLLKRHVDILCWRSNILYGGRLSRQPQPSGPAAQPRCPAGRAPVHVLWSNRWPAITTCTLIGLKSGSSDRFICVCDVGQWEAGGGAVARAAVGGPLDSASHRLRARQSLARFLPTMFIPDTLRSCMVEPDVSTYLQAPSSGQVHLF